jgi:hypothetical protein
MWPKAPPAPAAALADTTATSTSFATERIEAEHPQAAATSGDPKGGFIQLIPTPDAAAIHSGAG